VAAQFAAAVLAGGRASRFGSDKALAPFAGEPLLGRTLRLLRAHTPHLAVIAKTEGAQAYRPLAESHGAVLLCDASPLKTPLAGLSAALDWCVSLVSSAPGAPQAVFAVAADMPFVAEGALASKLLAALEADPQAAAALAFQGGSLQTLAGLWVAERCAADARALLSREKVGPRALLDRIRFATVPFPGSGADERPFLDADTPEALARLERLHR
jgi:molybdenum cofactor guanylyltransferase